MERIKHVKKEIIGVLVFAILFIYLAVPVFAWGPQDTVYTGDVYGSPVTHPYAFTSNYTTNTSQQIRLNQYTWGTPVSGTKVTTYLNDNTHTMWWGDVYVIGGGTIIACYTNPQVCLNIMRTSAQPEANVYNINGNRYGDIVFTSWYPYITIGPRYIHSTNMYLTETTAISGAGGGKYCVWTSSGGSIFNRYDLSYNTYG